MQPFDRYFRDRMKDATFKALYDAQCHVCTTTVRIFEKVAHENLSMAHLASAVGSDVESLETLRDADHCNPHLVIRLCRQLGLTGPKTCPKLNQE